MANYEVTVNVNGRRIIEEVKGAQSGGSARTTVEARYSGQRVTVIKTEKQ